MLLCDDDSEAEEDIRACRRARPMRRYLIRSCWSSSAPELILFESGAVSGCDPNLASSFGVKVLSGQPQTSHGLTVHPPTRRQLAHTAIGQNLTFRNDYQPGKGTPRELSPPAPANPTKTRRDVLLVPAPKAPCRPLSTNWVTCSG